MDKPQGTKIVYEIHEKKLLLTFSLLVNKLDPNVKIRRKHVRNYQ